MKGKVECDLFGCRIKYIETVYIARAGERSNRKFGNYRIIRTPRVINVQEEQQAMAYMFGEKFVDFEIMGNYAKILNDEPKCNMRR